MSKRFEIVTSKLAITAAYSQGVLEPIGEDARVLYAALLKLHETIPMKSVAAYPNRANAELLRYVAVAMSGLTWQQDIHLPGGPDKDPPMSYRCSPWRPSERIPVCAVRDALIAIRNRHGLERFEAVFHG